MTFFSGGSGRKGPLLLVALALAGLAYWALHPHPAAVSPSSAKVTPGASAAPAPGTGPGMGKGAPVSVATVTLTDFPVWMTGLGTVTPVYTVTLHSRVDGEMMKVHYTEGQKVKAGDLLAELDPRPFQVQLEQAQGQLAHDQALLDNARLDLKRYQVLVTTGAVPNQQLDTQAALVTQYEASVLSDQGQVDNARLQLIYCRITAPVSGRLGLRLVDPGNIVHAADTNGMVVLTQLTPITVIFPLPQDALPALLNGLKAPGGLLVEAWDRSNTQRLAQGHLMTIDNQVDVTTGMVKLRAEFKNGDEQLFPNQFVNARIRVNILPNTLTIPAAGVQQGNQGPYAYVVDAQQRVSVHKLRTGPRDGDRIAILAGLQAGDLVVTDGVDNLREGIVVNVSARDNATGAQP